MKRLVVLAASVALVAGLAPGTSHAATAFVFMNNFRFCNTPVCIANQNTTINVGDTVTWVFDDPACVALIPLGCRHTATRPGVFDSGYMPLNFPAGLPVSVAFSRTFTSAGTFSYICSVHVASPFPLGPMLANIIVV